MRVVIKAVIKRAKNLRRAPCQSKLAASFCSKERRSFIVWLSFLFGHKSIITRCSLVSVSCSLSKTYIVLSSTKVSYLGVGGAIQEQDVIVDLQPKSGFKIYMKSQTVAGEGRSWIEARGKFDNGEITTGALDFRNSENQSIVAHYCLIIKGNQIEIRSIEFNGFDLSANFDPSVKTSEDMSYRLIPKWKGCDNQ